MITIHEANAQDFATLGLGALNPTECTIEEKAGGLYELKLVHPMTADLRHELIRQLRIIKAPAPVRETPLLTLGRTGETVSRDIYRVETVSGRRLYLRVQPDQESRGLHAYKPGTEVVSLGLSDDGKWRNVVVADGGAAGWMWNGNLVFVRTETETIENDTPRGVVQPRQTREQLFRIVEIEQDGKLRTVTARAQHISYDMKGAIVTGEYSPEKGAADVVCEQLMARLDHEMPEFHVYCAVDTPVSGEYGGRNLLDCLLDPDTGVAAQANARVIRDNFDVFLLPFEERSRGVELRYGKNLLSAAQTTDTSGMITRIFPVGKDAEGNKLQYTDEDGRHYVDSAYIGEYPVIYAKEIEYDVVVSDELTTDEANTLLLEKATAEFEAGCDLAGLGLAADFVRLDLTEKYKHLANAYALHMYDSVPVIDDASGILAVAQMTAYKYDCVLDRYSDTSLGSISDADVSVYGYEIANGSVAGSKIIPNSLGGDRLKNLSVGYGKFDVAAVRQLSADAINAVRATIHELVAGEITTDQLYADLAQIAVAEITTANIENAKIEWATIATLTAQIAAVAEATIKEAKIDWAQIENAEIDAADIKDLEVKIAEIAAAEIGRAQIDWARITNVSIGTADIEDAAITSAKIALGAITAALIEKGAIGEAQIADGSITEAKIVSLNADVIKAGTLSVERLLIKGKDGLFRAINATDSGLTSEQLDSEAYQNAISGTVLVARSVTADKIAAKSITANEILSGTITAAEIDVSSLFAAEAVIGELDNYLLRTSTIEAIEGALDIWASEKIRLEVENKRNLLLDTGEAVAKDLTGASNQTVGSHLLAVPVSELLGEKVTYSADWVYEGDTPAGTMKPTWRTSYVWMGQTITISEGNTSGRIEIQYTVPESPSENFLKSTGVYIRVDGVTGRLTIKNFKLEKGDAATYWAPAPEDLGEAAKELRAELAVQQDGISAAVSAIEGNRQDIAALEIRSDGIEQRVESAEGDITELRTTAEGLEARITDEAENLQVQISAAADGLEILAGQTVGGTQLIYDTRLMEVGEDSDPDKWRTYGDAETENGTDGFNKIVFNASGYTADYWHVVSSPLTELPYGATGRDVTLSAWVYSGNWASMDAGNNLPCCLTLCLSNGSTARGFWTDRSIVTAGGAGWHPDISASGNLGNGGWRRIWTTIKLESGSFRKDDTTSYEYSACTHVFIQVHLRMNGEFRIKAPKLEFGNVPTDWSAHPEELNAGSSVSITRNRVSISTPKFEVNIPNGTGTKTMMSIDEQGVYGQSIVAPNVMPRYTGAATLYVDPAATSAQIAAGNYFRSISDAVATLNYKWLEKTVVISLAAGMVEYGNVNIWGIGGYGTISITGDSTSPATVKGRVKAASLTVRLTIQYLNIDAPGGAGNAAEISGGATQAELRYCVINGPGTTVSNSFGVYATNGGKASVRDCAIYNFIRPLYANVLSMLFGQNNKGNTTVLANGGMMTLTGTQPCASTTWAATKYLGGQVFTQSVTVDQGDYPSAAPAQPTTATYYAATTHTYSPKTGWATSGDAVRQGYTKNLGMLRGCMWFSGLTALAGKSILSATLRLTRNSTQGVSYGVAIQLYGTTMGSGMGGEPVLTKSYGTVLAGGIDTDTSMGLVWGETESFTIPAAAIADIAAGTTSGLMIVSDDSSLYQNKVYSRNYAGFIGASGETAQKPLLTVNYQ